MPAAGVYKKEIDLSLYVEISSELKVAIVGPFNKGSFDRTLITNSSILETTYGRPIDDDVLGQAFFAAREYLRNGNQAWLMRADSAANPAEYGKTGLRGTTEDSLATQTDGASSIPATRTLTSVLSTFVTSGALVGDFLEVHDTVAPGDNGWYVVTAVAATVLTVDRDWPVGSLASLDFTVYSSKMMGADDGATSVQAARTFTSAGATFITNGVVAGDILHVDDTSDPEDNGWYVIQAVPSETTLTLNREWREGELATLTYAVYGSNHRDLLDGDTSTAGEFVSAGAQFLLHGVKAGDILIIEDPIDDGDNGSYVITGLKTAAEATTLEVDIDAWPAGSLTALQYRVVPGVVTLQGESKGSWVNGYTARTRPNSNEATNFDLEVINDRGFVVETIFNLNSGNVTAELVANSAFLTAVTITGRSGPSVQYTNLFNGGEDGTTGLTDADLLGNSNLQTGLEAFNNIEEVEVDLLLIPGYDSQNIGDGLLVMSEQIRGDCMFLPDPPDFPTVSTPQEAIDWHNGVGGFGRTTALNSSHGASYWSWCQIYDPFHDKNRFTAPSGHAASVYAQSDNQKFSWFAPAGTRRGLVRGANDVRFSPDSGQRNAMQIGANVNPFVKFIKEGIAVYGQKTLLRTSSALNRVNVRRMLLYVERSSLEGVRPVTFEPNDEATDREIVNILRPLFDFVQTNRGLREFAIIPSSTDAIREQNKNVTRIFIKPTKAAEVIELQFILTAQTANFEELIAA